jgi:predicted AAA+ superfamily ATPase
MELEEIKQILIDQREELENSLKEQKIIKREFLFEYKRFLKSNLIKIITGPRRAGKSILGAEFLEGKNFAYVNFDDERLAFIETKELDLILQGIYEIYQQPDYIFLDEIQNIDKWELFVNRLKRSGFNLIVTGSNAKLLSKELATHLTGRHFALELYPFSFKEYLNFHNFNFSKENLSTKEISFLKRQLSNYLSCGGFPEVVQGENYKKYLAALYSTILTKDVLIRHHIKHVKTLKEVANYLISNFARLFTFNKLKNIFSLKSIHTAKNYFSFLEEVFLIFAIERFSYKIKERLTASRKIYVIDTGLINALSTKFSQEFGFIYENIVAIELLRKKALNSQIEIYYMQELNYEIDFMIKEGLKIKQLIQVCYDIENHETKKREINSLLKASEKTKCSNLLIITANYKGEEKIENEKIDIIPLWKWLVG